MTDTCGNCAAKISAPGMFSDGNARHPDSVIAALNEVVDESYGDLCRKCGEQPLNRARGRLYKQIEETRAQLEANINAFPIVTIERLPPAARWTIKGLVTANVVVGTGIFNEFSQGLSDMLGMTTTDSGMALKATSGETTARTILYRKAIACGANFVIGVDIDYGTTANNAAMINMQGTAIRVENLDAVLAPKECDDVAKFFEFHDEVSRLLALYEAVGPIG